MRTGKEETAYCKMMCVQATVGGTSKTSWMFPTGVPPRLDVKLVTGYPVNIVGKPPAGVLL